MRPLKLVTFDVTNTILKFRREVHKVYAEVATAFGIGVEIEKIKESFPQVYKSLDQEYPNFGSQSDISWKQWWNEVVKRTLIAAGAREDHIHLQRAAETLVKHYSGGSEWTVRNGFPELLKELQSYTYLGVISNFDPRLSGILDSCGISRYFDFILDSYSCGFVKPQRDIFDKALTLCRERIYPEESLHVGDSVIKDLNGARGAGWNAMLLMVVPPEGIDKKFIATHVDELREKIIIHASK